MGGFRNHQKEAKMTETELNRLNELLRGRCATCNHWRGNRENVFFTLNELESEGAVESFLSVPNTWAVNGECLELRFEIDVVNASGNEGPPEPCGVFGCILHEPIEAD